MHLEAQAHEQPLQALCHVILFPTACVGDEQFLHFLQILRRESRGQLIAQNASSIIAAASCLTIVRKLLFCHPQVLFNLL